jgi:hypothetical protein
MLWNAEIYSIHIVKELQEFTLNGTRVVLFLENYQAALLNSNDFTLSGQWQYTRCDQQVPRLGEWKLQFIAKG